MKQHASYRCSCLRVPFLKMQLVDEAQGDGPRCDSPIASALHEGCMRCEIKQPLGRIQTVVYLYL